jgi:hypothetical protein
MIMRSIRGFLCVVAGLALSGCHESIVYGLNFMPNDTAALVIQGHVDKELLQMYQMDSGSADPLAGNAQGDDPFGVAAARKAGMHVQTKPDGQGGEIVVLTVTVPLNRLSALVNTYLESRTLPPSHITISEHRDDRGEGIHIRWVFPQLGSQFGAAMYGGMVSLAVQMHADGGSVSGNGTLRKDRTMEWPIDPAKPTVIEATIFFPATTHVAIRWLLFVALGVAAIVAVMLIVRSRKKTA